LIVGPETSPAEMIIDAMITEGKAGKDVKISGETILGERIVGMTEETIGEMIDEMNQREKKEEMATDEMKGGMETDEMKAEEMTDAMKAEGTIGEMIPDGTIEGTETGDAMNPEGPLIEVLIVRDLRKTTRKQRKEKAKDKRPKMNPVTPLVAPSRRRSKKCTNIPTKTNTTTNKKMTDRAMMPLIKHLFDVSMFHVLLSGPEFCIGRLIRFAIAQ